MREAAAAGDLAKPDVGQWRLAKHEAFDSGQRGEDLRPGVVGDAAAEHELPQAHEAAERLPLGCGEGRVRHDPRG